MQTQGLGLGALLGLGGEGQNLLGINANNISDFESQLQSLLGPDVDVQGLLQAAQEGQEGGNLLPMLESELLPLADDGTDAALAAELDLDAALLTEEPVVDDVLAGQINPKQQEILASLNGDVAEKVRQILAQSSAAANTTATVASDTVQGEAQSAPMAPPEPIQRVDLRNDAVIPPQAATTNGPVQALPLRPVVSRSDLPNAGNIDARAATAGATGLLGDERLQSGKIDTLDRPLAAPAPSASVLTQTLKPIAETLTTAENNAMLTQKQTVPSMDVLSMAMQQLESGDGDANEVQSWRDALQSLSDRMPLLAERTAQASVKTDTSAAQILQNPAMAGRLQASMAPNVINERIQWMMTAGKQTAEIQLDPPELGALQVKVTTQNEQTSVSFVVANAGVREVLEQQLPRLREFFEQQGLELGDVDVSDQQSEAQQEMLASGNDGQPGEEQQAGNGQDSAQDGTESESVKRLESNGLVDLFA